MESGNPPSAARAAVGLSHQQQPNSGDNENRNPNNNRVDMGPQSQRRLSLEKRTHNMQSGRRKRSKKGGQLTLFGGVAFDSSKHCEVCVAQLQGREKHRAHHPRCGRNTKTKGLTSKATLETLREEKRLKELFAAPLQDHEKGSFRHLNQDNINQFFMRRPGKETAPPVAPSTTPPTTVDQQKSPEPTFVCQDEIFTPAQFSKLVTEKVAKESFAKEHNNKKAPLAMIAAAAVAVEEIIRPNNGSLIQSYFDGLTMTIPFVKGCTDPHYHSIMGQKLLLVDWKKMMGVDVLCPSCKNCLLKNDRTNFSKNKTLHPIFGLDGPPQWCMVMSMQCPGCKARFHANESNILCRLPAYASVAYPVDSRYAGSNKNSHVARSATDLFDMLLPTYGNGDLCSRLLYNAINRSYLERASSYYSEIADNKRKTVNDSVNDTMTGISPYIEKDGVYMRYYPPLGDMIRNLHNEASLSSNNHWGISDHDRHTREIQGVKCGLVFAQDHTHEVTKNYLNKKKLGIDGLWDVATETGEIACAVLVPSTKTSDFSHAAKQLTLRNHFNPKAMYSDTWPCKSEYWERLLGHEVKGRLGLFHFIQRITRTLRKKHPDYHKAVAALLEALYYYNDEDYDALLAALKNGTLSSAGTKFTDNEIDQMKGTRLFRQRYDKHLRKVIRRANVMRAMLEGWFNRYKCSSSDPVNRPAGGRRDPNTEQTLFTEETRDAWLNCKDKAEYLQDPLPLDEMYYVIPPNPNSPHQLNEYISRRGESSLESFHGLLAHFANCGMRSSLADNLNLTGTARYNLGIRMKLRIASIASLEVRSKMPGAWETVLPYFNHSELNWVNSLAVECGIEDKLPFPCAEQLGKDTGERFFSEYMEWIDSVKPRVDENDMCLCVSCGFGQNVPPSTVPITGTTTERTTVEESGILTATVTPPAPQQQPQLPTAQQPLPQQQMPNMASQHSPVFMFMPPTPGFFVPPPSYTPLVCCQRYQTWFCSPTRRGRPPHDWNCRTKLSPNWTSL